MMKILIFRLSILTMNEMESHWHNFWDVENLITSKEPKAESPTREIFLNLKSKFSA